MKLWRFAVGLTVTCLLALVLIWPFADGRWRGLEADPGSGSPTAPRSADSSTTSTLPEVSIIVAASGGTVERGLSPLEEAFLAESGSYADVRRLKSELEVWNLAARENLLGADVIEVGFRSDAMSGVHSDSFLPLDSGMVPSLERIPDEFRLPEDRGVVVGFSGLLGLAVSDRLSDPPTSWEDLAVLAELAQVGVPSPESVMGPVFVMALGEGDLSVGLDRYRALIEAGAMTLRSTEDFVTGLREGLGAAVWTTSGMWRSEGRLQGVEFVAPSEGAVALPAFAGILASANDPEAAMAWMEFRLSVSVQQAMASIAQQGRFGSQDVPAVSPVITGLEGLADGGLAYFTLDTFDGEIIGLDWTQYEDARAAIDALFDGGSS